MAWGGEMAKQLKTTSFADFEEPLPQASSESPGGSLFRFETFAWDISLRNFRFGTFPLPLHRGSPRDGWHTCATRSWLRFVLFPPFPSSPFAGRPGTGGTHAPPVPVKVCRLSSFPFCNTIYVHDHRFGARIQSLCVVVRIL